MSKTEEKGYILKSESRLKFFGISLSLFSTFMLLILICFKLNNVMDSDTAAEVLLGKEVANAFNLFPKNWCYSTEIRVLNIHLLIAPLLKFTSSMQISKSIANFILIVMYIGSYFFLLKSMKVKKVYAWLFLPLMLTPLTYTTANMLFAGAFYTSYLICIMSVIALINLLNENINRKTSSLIYIVLFIISFALGATGTRFLANLYIPMFITEIILIWQEIKENDFEFRKMKKTFLNKSYLFIVFTACGLGFLYFSLVLKNSITFYNIGDQKFVDFREIGSKILQNIEAMISIFGGVSEGKFISLEGIRTTANLVLLIASFIMAGKLFKHRREMSVERRNLIIFFWVALIVNSYIMDFSQIPIDNRYYINILMLFFPLWAIYFDENRNSHNTLELRILAIMLLLVCVICSQYKIIYKGIFNVNINRSRYEVISYLKRNSLDFGYATFWNADVITYLTEGEVEVANLKQNLKEPDYWLTSKKMYKSSYHPGKTFLLLTIEEEQKAESGLLNHGSRHEIGTDYIIYEFSKNPYNFD